MTEHRELHKIVIDVDANAVKYLGEQKYYNGFVSQEVFADSVRMTFLSCSLSGFARWFMLFGDHASIVEPLALNDKVAETARNILKSIQRQEMVSNY